MIFTGKITEISKVKVGKTKKEDDWASLDFEVTESNPHNELYPQIALFSYFKMGEYVKMASEFSHKVGDEVNVDFNFKCQKYNKKDGSGEGKFYKTECWKVDKVQESQTEEYNTNEVGNDLNENEPDDLPF